MSDGTGFCRNIEYFAGYEWHKSGKERGNGKGRDGKRKEDGKEGEGDGTPTFSEGDANGLAPLTF